MNLIILLLISAVALLNTSEIDASKRIKRNPEVKLNNSLKDDFVMLKTENQHLQGGGAADGSRKIEQHGEKFSKLNKTKTFNRPLTLILQGKETSSVSDSRLEHNQMQMPRKLVMRQSSPHSSELVQNFYEPNDDPVLDFIFNSLVAPKSIQGNTKNGNRHDDAQRRAIIYGSPVFFKQPLSYNQPKQEIEGLWGNALNNILMNDELPHNMMENGSDAGGHYDDLRCPVHQAKERGNEKTKQQINKLNDADVIQYCACHFIKKSKGDIKESK